MWTRCRFCRVTRRPRDAFAIGASRLVGYRVRLSEPWAGQVGEICMPLDSLRVVAQPDTFLRIARARPISAIGELIWNSLDAEASEVSVYFDQGVLGLAGILVEDDGLGFTPMEATEYFAKLGGSWKKPGARTKNGIRILHGSQGQGRYKALSLGRSVRWTYLYDGSDGIYEFALSILGDNPSEVRITDAVKSKRAKTGCIVEIREPQKQFRSLDSENTIIELTELFATYLSDYPGNQGGLRWTADRSRKGDYKPVCSAGAGGEADLG